MPYISIDNFKFGLDTRREQLANQPGTLLTCENGFINVGGEIERRKSFGQDADLSAIDSNADTGIFGLEVISGGLVAFGSAVPFANKYITGVGVAISNIVSSGAGGLINITVVNGVITAATVSVGGAGYAANDYVTPVGAFGTGAVIKILTIGGGGAILTLSVIRGYQQSMPVITTAMPVGYTYQQLIHPALTDSYVLDGPWGDPALGGGYGGLGTADATNYDRTKHRITSVGFSTNYNGKSFVSATFADGNTFLYYDGSIIRNSSDGVMFNSYTTNLKRNQVITYELARQVLQISGWGANANNASGLIGAVGPALPSLGWQQFCRIGCPASTTFAMSATFTASGVVYFADYVHAATSIVAAPPTGSFSVNGAPGNAYIIDAPFSTTNATRVYLNLSVAWAVSNNNTATLIATAVNLLTADHGYSAVAVGALVTITAPSPASPALGAFSGSFNVTSADVTAAGVHVFTTSYNNAFGQRGTVTVDGPWATGDTWTLSVAGSAVSFTAGLGNIANQAYICGLKFGQRIYIGFGSTFAFSAVNNVTKWESQDIGAGKITYNTQYGQQDTVQAFSQFQSRLAVFGTQSIQIWITNADPLQFSISQTLDNTGTVAPLSVQSVGDFDTYYLDQSGVRSLRAKEVTLNAFIDDVGSAINLKIQNASIGYNTALACGVVDPLTKNYWLYLNGDIYVFANQLSSQIRAWSTFKPTFQGANLSRFRNSTGGTIRFWYGKDADITTMFFVDVTAGASFDLEINFRKVGLGATPATFNTVDDSFSGEIVYTGTEVAQFNSNQTAFVPVKFVISNKRVYCLSSDNKVYLYGGASNNSYDNCVLTAELPWSGSKTPSTLKHAKGGTIIAGGAWKLFMGMDPQGGELNLVSSFGNAASPNEVVDSTVSPPYKFSYTALGTHYKIKCVTKPYGQTTFGRDVLSSLLFKYSEGSEV